MGARSTSKKNKMIVYKTRSEIERMLAAGRITAELLEALKNKIKPGVSTAELNDFVHEETTKRGATSAPLGYKADPKDPPFPKSICTSINNVVCHGIPSESDILKDGDIINCDLTVKYLGYHGDSSRTYLVGNVNEKARLLVERTEQAMWAGINAIKSGGCISDIGAAIEEFVRPFSYGIVRDLAGHGIGAKFHEPPTVYHYKNLKYRLPLRPGMTLTVEPMLNLGTHNVKLLNDGWTVVTTDKKWSAQFEHTVLVTEKGPKILTALE